MAPTRFVLSLALSLCGITEAKSLWSTKPAVSTDILRTSYPIGNGKLGALTFGEPGHEILSINRDSLWSGGPFENASYTGGNDAPRYQYLPGIRDWIWQNGTGNVTELMGQNLNYGSYAVLGNLSVTIDGVRNGNVTGYKRTLNLRTAVHTTVFTAGGMNYTTQTYCSYPDDVCVYDIAASAPLPDITVSLGNTLANSSLVSSKCWNGEVSFRGITQAEIGMLYQANVRVVGNSSHVKCDGESLKITKGDHKHLTLVLAAGTNFDQSKGTAEHKYSFRGEDPDAYVRQAVSKPSGKSAADMLKTHVYDYSEHFGAFTLELPDKRNSSNVETEELVARYLANNTAGDPYLESLTFDFARYLFISSSREGSLPPNLQGRWATELTNAWSADYHANINLQMNHWHTDQTGLGSLQTPLWEYMAQNWAPRGAETAQLLYNASGWVVHNEMNIFGHAGMKGDGDISSEIWANYPIAAAWMMQHVWDYFDYSQDFEWLQLTGYPMLKAISEFWLSQLQEDQYFNDGTLVVNPCTSAEHGPTTFGCTHHQQLIHQLFVTTLQASQVIEEDDVAFIGSLTSSLAHLDTGLHIGSFNQIQEWKLDLDTPNDTHRHLSHLIGWHPGFSVASYADGYANSTIQSSVGTSLTNRGVGITDANSGWEKVWRSAAWARLNETEQAHYELRLTIEQNWAGNLLSMYSGRNLPFQIDANFGFAGAGLSMLVVDLPQNSGSDGVRTVVLGPAIPAAWSGGSVKGLRIRGGGKVDFEWDEDAVVTKASLEGGGKLRVVNVKGDLLV